jgi:hypothetical protein
MSMEKGAVRAVDGTVRALATCTAALDGGNARSGPIEPHKGNGAGGAQRHQPLAFLQTAVRQSAAMAVSGSGRVDASDTTRARVLIAFRMALRLSTMSVALSIRNW